jgi:hypothetical protein
MLPLNMASKCITNFRILGLEMLRHKDKSKHIDTFVQIRDHMLNTQILVAGHVLLFHGDLNALCADS